MASNSCEGRTQSREPCKAPPLQGRPFCFHHDPERAGERKAARVRGGRRTRRPPVELSTGSAADVRASLDALLLETMRLGNSVKRNRCAGYLLSLALRALETVELEERVERLEELYGTHSEAPGRAGADRPGPRRAA